MTDGQDRATGKAKAEQRLKKYAELGHAVQSGIAWNISIEHPDVLDINADINLKEHKHLRVGIDTTKCDHAALVKLLIDKKIIKEDEYFDELLNMLQTEKERYEKQLSEHFGKNITLK